MIRIAIALTFVLAALARDARAASHTIVIVDFSYEPPNLVVQEGDTVTIEATGFHPLLLDDGSFSCTANCMPPLRPGPNPYHCANHGAPGGSGMAGTIVVTPAVLFADGFE